MNINNKIFGYISHKSDLTEDIKERYKGSLILVGDAHQLFNPLTNTWVGLENFDNININDLVNVQSDWDVLDNSSLAYIKNKPNINQTITGGTEIRNEYGHISLGGLGFIELQGNYVDLSDGKNSITLDQNNEAGINITANDGSDGTISLKASSNISVTPGTNSKFYYNNKEVATVDKIPTLVQSDWNENNSTYLTYIKNKPEIPSKLSDLTQDINYAASGTVGGAALKTGSIPFGVVDSTSTSTAFTATVPGITELTDGTCVLLKNGVVTSASGFTININGLGAHHAFNNMTAATPETTIFNINYTMLFVYDSTREVGGITGAWCCYRGYDINTIAYQIRCNSATLPCSDRARYYKIYFTSADGTKFVPASSDWSSSPTTVKPVNQRPINPWGSIVYTSASTNYTEGTLLAVSSAWYQYSLGLGYSFNTTGGTLTLTKNAPVYVKCAPQSNGSAIIDATTPIVQTLPTTEDGKIYIFLGIAYSAAAIELKLEHPVFYYKNGAIRVWVNSTEFDDSNLVHKTGNETINGIKTFNGNIKTSQHSLLEHHVPELISGNTLQFDWIKIHADLTNDDLTLQQALDERNNVQSDWNETNTTTYTYIKNKPTKLSAFTNDVGYITASDIVNKADKSAAIGSLSLSLDQSTYVITLSGTKVDGTAFTVNNSIDLPLESVVVSGNYNNTTKKVELTLKNGTVIEFSVADLIDGLQSEITPTNKLSGDLIEDGIVNKVINVQSDWAETDNTTYTYIKNKPNFASLEAYTYEAYAYMVSTYNNLYDYITISYSDLKTYTTTQIGILNEDISNLSTGYDDLKAYVQSAYGYLTTTYNNLHTYVLNTYNNVKIFTYLCIKYL